MAFLGKLFIAGSECLDGKYKSGISFSLSKKSPVSYLHETENGNWQVEFLKNSAYVVARTTLPLNLDSLQLLGYNTIQPALDILSVKRILSTDLTDPATTNIGVYCSDGKSVAYFYGLCDLPMGISSTVKQTDATGKEIKPPKPPEPIWNESFRYYRLSQSSSDLFEAYRNLFLAFEAILNNICPKNRDEFEAVWLKRSLAVVNSKISLSCFTPNGRDDAVKYILKSQYRDIRCKLQHAKFPSATLPHSQLSPVNVKQAYEELIRMWRKIAGYYFNVPTGGGVITHGGFEVMMTKNFNEGAKVFYTSDDSLFCKEDTEVSPQGFTAHEFITSTYRGQIRPGVVRLTAFELTLELKANYEKPIYRVCSVIESDLIGVAQIEQGLVISGVDIWECINDFRLINSSQPNIEFRT